MFSSTSSIRSYLQQKAQRYQQTSNERVHEKPYLVSAYSSDTATAESVGDPHLYAHQGQQRRQVQNTQELMKENEAPLREVYMTPMNGDTPSSSSPTSRSSITLHSRGIVMVSSSSSCSYSSPLSKKSTTTSRVLLKRMPSTPDGLKPRPSFQSLQSRIETTIISSDSSICSFDQHSFKSHGSSRGAPIFRSSSSQSRRVAFREIRHNVNNDRNANEHNDHRSFGTVDHILPLFEPGVRVDYAPSRQRVQSLVASTPCTPVLTSSSVKTAVGATVAESMKSINTVWEDENDYSWYSKDDSYLHPNEYMNDGYENESLRGWDRREDGYDVDNDIDNEPLTAVGKLMKKLAL